MNTQTMLDWAYERPVGIQHKLILIGLCLHCGADGGGSIRLGVLARGACYINLKGALKALAALQQSGVIIVHRQPDVVSADSDILFGLCMEGWLS